MSAGMRGSADKSEAPPGEVPNASEESPALDASRPAPATLKQGARMLADVDHFIAERGKLEPAPHFTKDELHERDDE